MRAVLLGIALSTAYSFAYILVCRLRRQRLHPFEIAFARSVICFLVIAAISSLLGAGGFRTQRRFTLLARGALSAGGLLLWFYGLVHLPLTEALILSQTTVCFASLGAALFLREPITSAKAIAISFAIADVAVIVQPGFDNFRPEYLAVLGAAACLVRSAAQTEDSLTIVLCTTLLIVLLSFPPAVAVWPSPLDLVIFSGIGLLSTLTIMAWTTALK